MNRVKTTPMQEQYQRLKKENPEALLFFRLGDFYELFGDDATVAAPILDVQLTTRDKVTPMCGVPYHAVDQYLKRLIDAGFTVAIAEQTEDPKQAKGLVERQIIRVVSPGTYIGENDQTPARLAVIYATKKEWALAVAELATGTIYLSEQRMGRLAAEQVTEQWAHWRPQEYLSNWPEPLTLSGHLIESAPWFALVPNRREQEAFLAAKLGTQTLSGWGLAEHEAAQAAVYVLWRYVTRLERQDPIHLSYIAWIKPGDTMAVSARTLRQLNVFSDNGPSLLSVLDKTCTPMGKRQLMAWLERPLASLIRIQKRQRAIAGWMDKPLIRDALRQQIRPIGDLAKRVSRVALGLASPKDLIAIRTGLQQVQAVYQIIQPLPSDFQGEVARPGERGVSEILTHMAILHDDPPVKWDEGGLIREGADARIDRYRALLSHQREALAQLEQSERERSGIKSLKVGYHRTFGYYLEVSHGQAHKVPDDWRRRQTMANAERFTSDSLLELERTIVEAETELKTYEYQKASEVLATIREASALLNDVARWLGEMDALTALAEVSVQRHYYLPQWNDDAQDRHLKLNGLRHPVLETFTQHFVPTHVEFPDSLRLALITGPNMGGKSTFMRAVALNVLLAHIGAPVACKEMQLPLFTGLYTRIGADDDIYRGQSTFMVEMEEMAWILRQSQRDSLVILDELGRGTSTFDGMAIAQAVAERLSAEPSPLTLFATHYHELTRLAETRERVSNLSVEVAHDALSGQLVFTHRVITGAASRSYGVEVAELAGLPKTLLTRARHLLAQWEEHSRELTEPLQQVTWFQPDPMGEELLTALAAIDPDDLSPREAWAWITDWLERIRRARQKGVEGGADTYSGRASR
ncbi:DNA mismatch repair protein MutS [Sulfobacillus sp. hq2]|uniref:DNA mismatch repair protein MutS n=1 Tax=Sulfobacillus TaxID=28033 RepID=UPI000CCFE8F3|nr:DNA mismatch repair protein MutS [Sulfobacillus sp. hq2]POB11545.1 DNA mismatch repair protein MutS [Sulfobacillus sp. hq2]